MFSKPPHNKAERKTHFGLFTKIEDIPPEDKKLIALAENTSKQFGSSFSDRLEVEKYQGTRQVDKYTALRPGFSSDES